MTVYVGQRPSGPVNTEPNVDVIRQWAEALESGKYQQGRGRLTGHAPSGEERHCCLGVLCKLAVLHGIIPPGTTGPWGDVEYGATESKYLLPREVQRWAGLTANPAIASQGGAEVRATTANDDLGYSFGAVAQNLRKTYLGEDPDQ